MEDIKSSPTFVNAPGGEGIVDLAGVVVVVVVEDSVLSDTVVVGTDVSFDLFDLSFTRSASSSEDGQNKKETRAC